MHDAGPGAAVGPGGSAGPEAPPFDVEPEERLDSTSHELFILLSMWSGCSLPGDP